MEFRSGIVEIGLLTNSDCYVPALYARDPAHLAMGPPVFDGDVTPENLVSSPMPLFLATSTYALTLHKKFPPQFGNPPTLPRPPGGSSRTSPSDAASYSRGQASTSAPSDSSNTGAQVPSARSSHRRTRHAASAQATSNILQLATPPDSSPRSPLVSERTSRGY